MNKLLSVILTLIITICSCCSDKEGDDNGSFRIITVPQEVKDYVIFKPGTYWIYKDSASGIEDSVYVYDYIDSFDTVHQVTGNTKPGIYEWFEIKTHSSLDGYDYYYKFFADNYIENPQYMIGITREKLKPGDYVGEDYCLIYPFTIGYHAYWGPYGVITVVNYFTSFNIGTESYLNVSKFHQDENSTEHYQDTYFYFSKNIGIIRKELLDSAKVWNIDRYFIVQ